MCDRDAQQADCASEEEFTKHLAEHQLGIITAFNYINFDEVDPFKGPLKDASQWIDSFKLDHFPDEVTMRRYSMQEHRIELEDSIIQIMTEPLKFKFLNIDKTGMNLAL